uniref:Uncharacterized protein n=1 Tax=Globodera pallida TaxID=36090 RepID=A0A183BXW7_GLOPA
MSMLATFYHQPQQQFLPVFLPLLLPLSSILSPGSSHVAAQCSGGGCGCAGCAGCGGCQQLQLGGGIFPMAINTINGTVNSSNSSSANLNDLVPPKIVVESKKNLSSPAGRRRRRSTTTDWGSEKMLTPQQLDAKFQLIRLLQQRPLSPLQPELPPLQPPDFPPLSVPPDDVPPSSAYGDDEAAGKFRPQATSGLGQFIHVKPTVMGTAFGLLVGAEMEDSTLKHPFEEPFQR